MAANISSRLDKLWRKLRELLRLRPPAPATEEPPEEEGLRGPPGPKPPDKGGGTTRGMPPQKPSDK